jgi:hypothetical protein
MPEPKKPAWTPLEWRMYGGRARHSRLLNDHGYLTPVTLCGASSAIWSQDGSAWYGQCNACKRKIIRLERQEKR